MNGIKQLINIDKKSTQKQNCIKDKNRYIHDAKKMAEMFNNHFSQVGQGLGKSIRTSNKKYDDCLKEKVENSFIIEPTNNDEALSVIK